MPSRERRLLDKDKEIRKLKCNLGHYFTNSVVLGIKNEILKQQLKIATDALKYIQDGNLGFSPAMDFAEKALEQITELEQKESAFVHNKIEFPKYNDNLLEEFDKQFFENGQDDDLTETALEQKDVK